MVMDGKYMGQMKKVPEKGGKQLSPLWNVLPWRVTHSWAKEVKNKEMYTIGLLNEIQNEKKKIEDGTQTLQAKLPDEVSP